MSSIASHADARSEEQTQAMTWLTKSSAVVGSSATDQTPDWRQRPSRQHARHCPPTAHADAAQMSSGFGQMTASN